MPTVPAEGVREARRFERMRGRVKRKKTRGRRSREIEPRGLAAAREERDLNNYCFEAAFSRGTPGRGRICF